MSGASISLPAWVVYIQALGPTFVAIVAACIATSIQIRQWKTAHAKLRLDLLEKRLVIYRRLGGSFFGANEMEITKNLMEIYTDLQGARLVFPDPIVKQIDRAASFVLDAAFAGPGEPKHIDVENALHANAMYGELCEPIKEAVLPLLRFED